MLISLGRLERNPTFKEQVRDLNLKGEISFGHLGYPVLQAADILAYRAARGAGRRGPAARTSS